MSTAFPIRAPSRHRMRTVRLAPTTSNTTTTTALSSASRMASTLFRRQLARVPRLATPTPSSSSSLLSTAAARRHLSGSAVAQAEPAAAAQTAGAKNVFDTHTVEDLHGMHATEILAETGTRRDAQLRHFTGEYAVVRGRAGSVLTALWRLRAVNFGCVRFARI